MQSLPAPLEAEMPDETRQADSEFPAGYFLPVYHDP